MAEPMELEHAIGFSGAHTSLHALPATQQFVTVVGGCIVMNDVNDAHNQVFLRGHDTDVTCLKVSPTGRFMLSGQKGQNPDVCLWDVNTMSVVQRFSEHDKPIAAVSVSCDDSIIATICSDNRLAFFDTSNGGIITHTPLSAVLLPDDVVRDATFGCRVQDVKRRDTNSFHFCVCTSGTIWAVHLDPFAATLSPLKLNLVSFQRRYSCVAYSALGDMLFIGSDAGDVAVVSTGNGAVVATCRVCSLGVRQLCVSMPTASTNQQDDNAFRYARFGPGSERSTKMYVGGGDGSVSKCMLEDHSDPVLHVAGKHSVGDSVLGMTILGDDDLIVSTTKGQTSRVACGDGSSGAVSRVSDAVSTPYDSIVPHPSNPEKFITASRDGVLRQWELNDYRIGGVFQNHVKEEAAKMSCSAISVSDGLEIQLSSWSDGCVRCHDMTNFALLWTHTSAHRSAITALCVSSSMKFYITGSAEGEIKVWDIRTRELKGELKDHKQNVVALQLFEDDCHLISASKDRTVVTWDLVHFRRLTSHEAHAGPLTSMFLSKNQCNVYTAGMDRTIAQWDLRQKEPIRVVPYSPVGSDAYCTCIRRSEDETTLVTGGTDQLVKLWDERSMTVTATGRGHSGTVTDCAFTCDGKQVLSCGSESAVLVWNVYNS
jgi:WD40 repeat protein